MLLKQIHYFVTIVDCNSFTEAAEQCYISQSAISQQINNLENDIGVRLIERGNRKFSLTPAGEYFYKYGKELLLTAEHLRDETKRIASDDEVRLRIGYLNGYEGRELLDTVQKFAMLYPEVILNVARYSHEDLYMLYNSDNLDMALSYQRRAFSDQNVNYHIKYADYVIEVPSRGELAGFERITTEDIQKNDVILIAKKEQQHVEQDFYQNRLGIGSQYVFAESYDDARIMVAGNQGIFPLPAFGLGEVINPAIKRIPLVYPDGAPIQLDYCAFWKKRRSNYYIEEFAAMLHSCYN